MDELRRRRRRRQRRVDLEARFGAAPSSPPGRAAPRESARQSPRRSVARVTPGRHRMAAALDRDARFDRRARRRPDRRPRSSGRSRSQVPGEAQREGRALKRSLSRAASRPTMPGGQVAPATTTAAPRSSRPKANKASASASASASISICWRTGSAGRVRSRSSRASMSSVVVRSRTPRAASPMRPPALMRGPMTKPK